MPEAAGNFAWILSLYFTVRGVQTRTVVGLLLAGLFLAVAASMKPVYFFLWLPTALSIWLLTSQQNWGSRLKNIGLFGVGFAVGVAPIYVRNYILWDTVVFSVQGGSQQYFYIRNRLFSAAGELVEEKPKLFAVEYSDPRVPSIADPRVPETAAEWEQKFGTPWNNLAKRHAVLGSLAREDFRRLRGTLVRVWLIAIPHWFAHTATTALVYASRPYEEVPPIPPGGSTFTTWKVTVQCGFAWHQILTWIVLVVAYVGSAVGFIELIRNRLFSVLLTLIMPLAYFTASMTVFPMTRYRFSAMYLLAILAAVGLIAIQDRIFKSVRVR